MPLIDTPAAADLLAVHPVTLRRWAGDGRIQGAVKVGSRWRFDPARLAGPTETPDVHRPAPRRVARRRATAAPNALERAFVEHRPRAGGGA